MSAPEPGPETAAPLADRFGGVLRFGLPLLFLALVLLALSPSLSGAAWGSFSSRYDWRYFESMSEVARRSVVWYHQAPLWNPYSCGGEVDLANPQSLVAAPTFLYTLLFGTAVGFKLALLTYYVLALFGMYRLARWLGLAVGPALIAACSYGLSGYLALHLAVGHINFAGVALYPLLIYCFDRAQRELEWILPAGAVAAWVAVYGGTFTPAMAGVLLFLWATAGVVFSEAPEAGSAASGWGKRLGRAYGLLFACAVIALLIGAVRMVPALEFISDHPRPLFRRTPDISAIWRLPGDLFAWRDFGPTGRRYWSHEYTARLPLLCAPLLFVAALASARFRTLRRRLVLLSIIAALLSLGNFSPVAPWSLLQKLPVLRDLRVPSRHLVLLAFFVSLLAGLGAQAVCEKLAARQRPELRIAVLAVLVLATGIDGALYTRHSFRDVFTASYALPSEPPRFYHTEGHWSQMRDLILAGHGVLKCDEEAPLQRAERLEAGDVPQLRLSPDAAGAVVAHVATPNQHRITLRLERAGGLLLLNSNWNEHWKSSDARAPIVRPAGQLALDLAQLPAGEHTLTVSYAPRSFAVGTALTLAAGLLSLGLFVTARRRRQR